MKRSKNILGFDKLMEILKNWTPKYPGGTVFYKNRHYISPFKPFHFLQQNIAV